MEKSLTYHESNKLKISTNIQKLTEEIAQDFTSKLKTSFLFRQYELHENKTEVTKDNINNFPKEIEINEPSIIIAHSSHSSNDSLEFEKCMAELDKLRPSITDNQENISINKSFGGWKSEFESDNENESILPINPEEIKSAISILKKANLLNSQNRNLLGKLSDVVLNPENSHNFELLFQLLNLENKSKHSPSVSIHKPPLGTNKYKLIQDDLACTTPKGGFKIPEDIDMGRTILSSENPITARHDEIQDNLSESLENSTQNLNDVQLEDLLNVYNMKFDNTDLVIDKPVLSNCENHDSMPNRKNFFNELENFSNSGVKASPVKKNIQGTLEYLSTGISSQGGLRSRITLKTVGSEYSQKVFTPGSKGIEESFKYL